MQRKKSLKQSQLERCGFFDAWLHFLKAKKHNGSLTKGVELLIVCKGENVMKENKGLMTSGNIYAKIALFAIPLLLGNFFQLMYNTIDSIIVGNYVGASALAAVGASTPIINLLIGFFQGLATGAGVVVSRFFGARRVEDLSKAVHSFIVFALIVGIILGIAGCFGSSYILRWIGTKPDYYADAESYLFIYFIGAVFLTLYNAGTGILQAVGDSRHPLYFLVATSIINIILDIVFVRFMDMGVSGAALATIIAEAISMVLVLRLLLCAKAEYKLSLRKLGLNLPILRQIIEIGVPAGVQGMIVSVSNIIVMAYINSFGAAGVAGFSCANKIDNFLGLPVNSLMLATTTFCGQNLGANNFERVRKGVRAALIMSISIVVSLGVVAMMFSDQLMSIFTDDASVIHNGTLVLRTMCPFYTFLCFHQVYSGALRASGRSSLPMITSITSFVVIRQIFLALFTAGADITVIGWSYSITWGIAAMLTGICYFGSGWLKKEETRAVQCK